MLVWLLIFLTAVVGIGIYVALLWTNARYHVIDAPRTPMFDCPVHGLFPKKYALDLGNGDLDLQKSDGRTIREAFLYCPMCYEDKMKKAKA